MFCRPNLRARCEALVGHCHGALGLRRSRWPGSPTLVGVDPPGRDDRWRKLLAFVVSAALAGLAGGLFASWGNFISPEVFSLPQAALVVIWVLVGGRGTLWGAVVGTVVVQYLTGVLGGAGSTYTTIVLGS